MPLTLEELQGIQGDAMADDLEIDFEKMSLWTAEQATACKHATAHTGLLRETAVHVAPPCKLCEHDCRPPMLRWRLSCSHLPDFESGGEEVPGAAPPAPAKAAPMPKPSEDTLKLWFPFQARSGFVAKPKFRIVCFHNAGSSESVYTGKGMRQTSENPFVVHCKENGGELLAVQLPGRDARRTEPRHRKIQPYAEQIFPILAPLLQDEAVPYVVVSHSMGTWMAYEFLKLVAEKGIPYPKQLVVSGFPAPSWPEADRPWNKNAPMADPAFMDECRGWNVNEIVFQEGNWKVRAQQGRGGRAREGGPGREGPGGRAREGGPLQREAAPSAAPTAAAAVAAAVALAAAIAAAPTAAAAAAAASTGQRRPRRIRPLSLYLPLGLFARAHLLLPS
jgi:hypothetical protein